jgi:hypothetical protein
MIAHSAKSEPLDSKLLSSCTIMTTLLKQHRHGSRIYLFATSKVLTGLLLKSMASMSIILN